eukprot:3672-Heterococcus_DN1.PRE.5
MRHAVASGSTAGRDHADLPLSARAAANDSSAALPTAMLCARPSHQYVKHMDAVGYSGKQCNAAKLLRCTHASAGSHAHVHATLRILASASNEVH